MRISKLLAEICKSAADLDEDKSVSELGSRGAAIEVTHPVCPLSSPLRVSVSAMLAGRSLWQADHPLG